MGEDIGLSPIETVKTRALEDLNRASNQNDLEYWRVTYLGRNGHLTQILRSLGSLSPDERRRLGAYANQTKKLLEEKLSNRHRELKENKLSSLLQKEGFDVTLPGWAIPQGRIHPITQTVREICRVFETMGFDVVEGPEVEWDKYNFEMLNIPNHHPAREMWDTLWIDYIDKDGNRPMLLRTHTSPMQARIMENTKPPVRVVVPGKCYRYEATDATHEWQLSQIEGLAVDAGITFADLKGTVYEFIRRMFGEDRQIRFRCDFFPFVEPGVEISMDCFNCTREGCSICNHAGWIEIAGAGMIHPQVLTRVGYDPQVYTGFAFGFGIERIAMLKYGIEDIRFFYANDPRFLKKF